MSPVQQQPPPPQQTTPTQLHSQVREMFMKCKFGVSFQIVLYTQVAKLTSSSNVKIS